MKLQEIINDLVYGELSQINIGANEQGRLDQKEYNKVVSAVNLGLTDLHTRFSLKINTIELIFNPGRYRYHLHSHHKFSDESLVVGDFRLDVGFGTLLVDTQDHSDAEYIRDQPYAEFEDDILLITKVQTCEDRDLPLNVEGNPWSVKTPKANVIEFPRKMVDKWHETPGWLQTDRAFVTYRQRHPRIPAGAGEYDGNRVELDLPETHRQALLYFIASRIMNPIGMGQEFNAGNTYMQKYLLECKMLDDTGMQVDQASDGARFSGRGFV